LVAQFLSLLFTAYLSQLGQLNRLCLISPSMTLLKYGPLKLISFSLYNTHTFQCLHLYSEKREVRMTEEIILHILHLIISTTFLKLFPYLQCTYSSCTVGAYRWCHSHLNTLHCSYHSHNSVNIAHILPYSSVHIYDRDKLKNKNT
jgi:hypothetical protein